MESAEQSVNAKQQTGPQINEGWNLDDILAPSGLFCLNIEKLLSDTDPKIKFDIIRMIAQYLNDEGYIASKTMVLDETNLKTFEREEQLNEIKRMKMAILGILII